VRRAPRHIAAALLCVVFSAAAFAQAPRDARLLVTVVDQTRAVLPDAKVTVTGLETATKKDIAPVQASGQGVATLTGLTPGRYLIQAEFPGFVVGVLPDVRLRAGDNRQTITLALQAMTDEVTVGRDKQESAADRQSTFGSALTRDQVDALPDDPDELAAQLQEMAGGNAVIRVDSFEGGTLPPKAQIKSIHITRDAFAAENHNPNQFFIDIITQPGIGPLRGGGRYSLRDGALAARNPFTPIKGPERLQNYGTFFGGSLLKDRSSFNLSINGQTSYDTPNLNAALPTGTVTQALSLRSPRTNHSVFANVDYAITKDQTLRVMYNQFDTTQGNLGVGAFDLSERAYANESHEHNFRLQEAGPLGRRFFTNTRFEFSWSNSASTSSLEAPTLRVNDAFTSGGAQQAGGRSSHTFNLASDLDYVRGIHSVRTGVQLNGGAYSSNSTQNYLGTYTFDSLAAYAAGTPRSYIRRVGDPNIDYFNMQAAAYFQDDIRLRKGLTITPGVRYEAQTHLSDFNAFGPRLGVTWSPWKSGKTTLRASAGVFYDWLNSGTYEQTLQVDGVHQRELNIINPSYPDPGNLGVVPPTNKYFLGDDLQMARNTRLSAGVDRQVTTAIRAGVTYAHTTGTDLLRGLNLNQAVNSVRPNPAVGNLVEVVGDATSRQNTLNFNVQVNLSPPTPMPSKQLWDGKRFNFGMNYILGRIDNNTDGAFSFPASGNIADDWGPANGDVRHRLNAFVGTQALRNFQANLNLNYASATPYTMKTGFDNNGDLIFNDRPSGVGRNTLRADSSFTLNGFFSYAFLFGPKRGGLPPGIMINGGGGDGLRVQTFNMDALPRYRLAIQVQTQNLLNTTNYTNYTGSLTSPFFGIPQSAQGMRKIDVGLNFNF